MKLLKIAQSVNYLFKTEKGFIVSLTLNEDLGNRDETVEIPTISKVSEGVERVVEETTKGHRFPSQSVFKRNLESFFGRKWFVSIRPPRDMF